MYISDESYEALLKLKEQVDLLRDLCQSAHTVETTGDRLSSQFDHWGDALTKVVTQVSKQAKGIAERT